MNDKKHVFDEFLRQKNISTSFYKNFAETMPPTSTIIVYASILDGLGTTLSDVDVYVIDPNPNKKFHDGLVHFEGLELDIEYWSIDKLQRSVCLLDSNNASNKLEVIKFLLRLENGLIIQASKQNLKEKYLSEINLNKILCAEYSNRSRSLIDDAVQIYNDNLQIAALDESQRAVWMAIAAYNAFNHHGNVKEKWISRIFISNNGFGHPEFVATYKQLCVFCKINTASISQISKERIRFAQKLLFAIEIE